MKNKVTVITLLILCAAPSLFAGGGQNGFLQTAAKYDRQAAEARSAGKHDAARILSRMADIKRAAAAGKLKNWDEYHQLAGQLKQAMGWAKHGAIDKSKEKKGIKKYTDKKSHQECKGNKKESSPTKYKGPKKASFMDQRKSTNNNAESSARYDQQAAMHLQQSNLALRQGDRQLAAIHKQLANLLVNASAQVSEGKKPDLTEYFDTQKSLFSSPKSNEDDIDQW